jgi:lysophospholipase L1-like esterase
LIELGSQLCPNGVCQQDVGAPSLVRPDGVHFSISGAHDLTRWLFAQIQN